MDKMEFDRTRKAIKADKLKEADRKDMMDKLHGAGGQVMRERSVNPVTGEPESKEKGKPTDKKYGMAGEPRLPSELAREKSREELDRQTMIRKYREQMEREASGFTARFIIKLRCKIKGIAPFGRNVVRPEFMSLLNLDMKRAVMECHIVGNDLFLTDANNARKIVKELDQKQPLYAELIERASNLYNRNTLNSLTGFYSANPEMEVPFSEIRTPLIIMIRNLYYLKPFQETYLAAVEMAIGIQQLLEKKQDGLYIAKKKKIRKEWDTLMNLIFPQMVLLLQRIELKQAEPFTELFDHLLDVRFEDRPGRRKSGDPLGAIAEKKEPEKPVEEGETEAPAPEEVAVVPPQPEVVYGQSMMMLYRPERLRKEFDPRNDWGLLSIRDKVLLSYLYMRLFETDYSFVLSSPKIQINSFFRGGARIDIKRSMSVILERGHTCHDTFRKYLLEAIEHYRVSTTNAPPGGYVEHQKLLTILEGRRGTSGQQVREMVADFMNKVREALRALVEDINGAKQIVVNTDEIYTFDLTSDSSKRLNGKPVKICIWEAFCFASALAHEIESGFLYGGVIDISEGEYFNQFPEKGAEPDPSLIPYRANSPEPEEGQ